VKSIRYFVRFKRKAKSHDKFAVKVFGIKFRGNAFIVSRDVARSQTGNG